MRNDNTLSTVNLQKSVSSSQMKHSMPALVECLVA